MTELQRLQSLIDSARRIVFFDGFGNRGNLSLKISRAEGYFYNIPNLNLV